MYSARLLDHFENPRHAGDLAEANARVRLENPACGDILELAAHVDDAVVREIRFRAKGCVPTLACASAVTSLARGATVVSLSQLQKEDVLREVDGVPPASGHAAQLAVDALHALLHRAA